MFVKKVDLDELNQSWMPQLDRRSGLKFTAFHAEKAQLFGECTVSAELLQPHGIMHGGFSCVLGETMGSVAGNLCLSDSSQRVVGQSLQAFHLRPIPLGQSIQIECGPIHLGRRTQIWETSLKDPKSGKIFARITLQTAIIS